MDDPLYICPLDSYGMVMSSFQLTRAKSYSLWSRTTHFTLLNKNKIGFINLYSTIKSVGEINQSITMNLVQCDC